MNNLVYTNDLIVALIPRIVKHVDKNGRIFYPEDILGMIYEASSDFEPKVPTADELKNSGEYEQIASVAHLNAHFSAEPPKDDDIASQIRKTEETEQKPEKETPAMQQASDVEDVANHIAAAADNAKICKKCGKIFEPETPGQRICPECRKENKKESNRKYARAHSERNKKAKSTDKNVEQYANRVADEVKDIESTVKDLLAFGDDE